MFTWICPQCGREVPPAYNECPDCTKKPEEAAAPAQASGAPLQPAAAMPPQAIRSAGVTAPAAPAPTYAPAPAPSRGLPTWLLTIVFTLAFVGLGAGIYWGIGQWKHREAATPAAAATLETPGAAKADAKPNRLQKFVEVTGVRLYQNDKKRTEARFLIVNHSDAEIVDLAGTVEIRGRTGREAEEAVGSFAFKIPNIGAQEAKEITAPVDTKLKVYELPDWQNIDARLRITAP
jgi:hypothetical protein